MINTLENLENKKELKKIKKEKNMKKLTSIKAAAIAVAAIMTLTLGVGAANEWNYSNVFVMLFSDENGELADLSDYDIGHVIQPEITGVKNRYKDIDFNVLGIAGDSQSLFIIIEYIGENLDVINMPSPAIRNFKSAETGKSLLNGNWGSGGTAQVLSETDNGIIAGHTFEISGFSLEKGYLHMATHDNKLSFKALIDYDFGKSINLDVNEIANLPQFVGYSNEPGVTNIDENLIPMLIKSVEVTPIAVRYTTDTEAYTDTSGYAVTINLKNGKTLNSKDNARSGGSSGEIGKDMTHSVHFDTPFNLDEVYSVVIGDLEIIL
jgi:hypothetical protein